MPEDLQYEPLEAAEGAADPAMLGQDGDLRRLRDVPVNLTVEIGRAQMTVGETLALRPGSIVTLDRLAEEPLDLLVNGTWIARGEVVVIDENFGLRVTEVQSVGGDQALEPTDAVAAERLPAGGEAAEVVSGEVADAQDASANAA